MAEQQCCGTCKHFGIAFVRAPYEQAEGCTNADCPWEGYERKPEEGIFCPCYEEKEPADG